MADSSLAEVPGAPDLSGLEQLKNEKSEALFDTIDRLREFKVGQLVHLPQIIVVGNQSSGKSSVLRAISRAPFPTAGGVCTRFATELRLRRSPIEEASVSIRWNDSSSPFRRTGINLNDLPSIINEAKERMGIRKGGKKDYSKDILQIQISRPDACELTLVDLPGFFSQSTEDQNVEGATLVNELVDEYMKQSNSIILAVMSANQTLATQGILERAKPFDPKKERTLGVITKPDLAVPGSSDEGHFIKAARNEEAANKLALGWHVLRNTGETEGDVGPQERDDIEERFFQSGAWSRVPKRDRGVVELRKKLSNILLEHIQKTLPNLVMEIETSLYSRQEALDRLGAARAGPKDYRSYLIRLSTQFQSLAADAVDGNYGDEFFGDLYSDHGPSAGATPDGARKLRAMIRNLSRTFDLVLSTKGAKNTVIWDDATDEEEDSTSGPDDTAKVPDYLQNILALYDTFEESEPIAEGELNDRLRILASETQGKELPGAPNSALVVKLFQEQSQPWRAIAWRHITLCMDVCKSFVEQLFSHVIGDDATTMDSILRTVVDPFFAAKEKDLRAKLDELIRPYTKGYYALLEAEFLDRLSDRTSRRLADRLHMALSGKANPSRDDIQRALKGDSDDETNEFGTDKVIDMMLAYYQMARRTFTENVINLAVESCLMADIPNILTPLKVDVMSEERLEELAAESEYVQSERAELQNEADILRKGLDICKKYRPREATVLPPGLSLSSPSSNMRRVVSRETTPVATSTVLAQASSPSHGTNGLSPRPKPKVRVHLPPAPSTSPSVSGSAASSSQTKNQLPQKTSPAQVEPKQPVPSLFASLSKTSGIGSANPSPSPGSTPPKSVLQSDNATASANASATTLFPKPATSLFGAASIPKAPESSIFNFGSVSTPPSGTSWLPTQGKPLFQVAGDKSTTGSRP